ncbi:MAG: hypothetical protein ACLFPQ_04460 [Candidatus Woesearchaeota archaeon]
MIIAISLSIMLALYTIFILSQGQDAFIKQDESSFYKHSANNISTSVTGYALAGDDNSRATRIMPAGSIYYGDQFSVDIDVYVDSDYEHTYYAVEETYPEDFTIDSSGELDESEGTYEVNSVFYEKGEKINEKSDPVEIILGGERKPINVRILSYALLSILFTATMIFYFRELSVFD